MARYRLLAELLIHDRILQLGILSFGVFVVSDVIRSPEEACFRTISLSAESRSLLDRTIFEQRTKWIVSDEFKRIAESWYYSKSISRRIITRHFVKRSTISRRWFRDVWFLDYSQSSALYSEENYLFYIFAKYLNVLFKTIVTRPKKKPELIN